MTFQTTKILGAAPGVQYGGVQDNSTGAPKVDLSIAVVVGRFRRGRIDRMFAVTKESIRARLGYQPSNPDYQVVQDALDLGVPQVWVRRIRGVIDVAVGDCTPSYLQIPIVALPDTTYRIYYQFDDAPMDYFEYEASSTYVHDLFSEFFGSIGVVDGGGGTGSFFYYSGGLTGASTEAEGALPQASSLHLLIAPVSSPAVDLVALVFGESVVAHSCAVVNWQGV